MDWLIGLLLVVAGALIGFFAARHYFKEHSDSAEMAAKMEESRQQFEAYRRDVVEHLETARHLSSQVNEVQHKLNDFLENSQNLLEQDKEWQQPLPFFSEDTMRQLRNQSALEKDRRDDDSESTEAPPRDYSAPGSGLFSSQQKD